MKCPKCGYERRPRDEAPVWQCPACHIAYVKAAKAAVPHRAESAVRNEIAPPTEQVPVPEAASRRERARQDQEETEAGLREWKAARGQKILVYGILLNFVLGAVDRAHVFPDLVMLGLYLLATAWSLLGIVTVCSGLRLSQGQKILFMVLMFFPLINLIVLVVLNVKATRLLREAGWSVGLLGARR